MKKPLLWVLILAMSISLVAVFSSGGCGPAVSAGEEKPESEEALGLSEQPDKELFDKYISDIRLGSVFLLGGNVNLKENRSTFLPHQKVCFSAGFKNKKNFIFRTEVLNMKTNDFIERCAATISSEGADGFGIEGILFPVGKYEYRIYIENILVAALPFEVISYVDYFFGNSGEEPIIEEAEVEEVTGEPEEKALDEPEAESPNVEETTKESKIYFSSDRDSQHGDMELYIMNVDGSEQTKIEGVLEPNYDPYFTPDGSKCISFSECGDNREIYLSDINGTGEVNLTNNPADDWGASFSPDGLKIVFLSNRDGNLEIYIMNVDGSEQTRLTNNPANEYAPCFSLDGSKIAFNSYRDGNSEIYIMNTDGSKQVNLTNNPADDHVLFFTTMY